MYPRISMRENEVTVYLIGDIDHHTAKEIREVTDSVVQLKKPGVLRLDFSGVTFMDSSGIGLVMGRYRMMLLYGGQVKAVNVPNTLERIMNLSGLGSLNIIEHRGEINEIAQ